MNQLSREILADVNDNGQINYTDALNGAELLLVTNNNTNFQETNHQNFQNFGTQLPADRDLSDWVTGKASFQITHGGQQQLDPGSQELKNLDTYLNLIE